MGNTNSDTIAVLQYMHDSMTGRHRSYKAIADAEERLPASTPDFRYSLSDLLGMISYKPNWKFSMREAQGLIIIAVEAMVQDVEDPRQVSPIVLEHNFSAGKIFSSSLGYQRAFIMEVGVAIKRMELHEMDEWFKFRGACVENPHPEIPLSYQAKLPDVPFETFDTRREAMSAIAQYDPSNLRLTVCGQNITF